MHFGLHRPSPDPSLSCYIYYLLLLLLLLKKEGCPMCPMQIGYFESRINFTAISGGMGTGKNMWYWICDVFLGHIGQPHLTI